ncbi:MAG: hypothetical protein WDN04_24910 [Rhodospirillales bacterium]
MDGGHQRRARAGAGMAHRNSANGHASRASVIVTDAASNTVRNATWR